ncbi:MAG: DUF1887 family CARF protein [Thiothrix sp.]|uniref:Card1-like endonuclease domain-containing protein n=1 Tax=Thiothrix sp. TaxID=1032 RepID=UPI002627E9F8|nr:DUF1887 family CARF protein [Thiothrix sp.]MDD5392738.1 DUF1887 family CARF protein [Thiothrix sp.]
MHIHICIISDQLLANYIPVLVEKPDLVLIQSTALMAQRGLTARFEGLLSAEQFEFTTHFNMPDTRMSVIHAYARNLYVHIGTAYPNARVTLNITGGNKLMSLGMLDIFGAVGCRVIYADTANNCIEYLSPSTYDEPIPAVLDIPQYLRAYGAVFTEIRSDSPAWQECAMRRKTTAVQLARLSIDSTRSGLISVLNGMASSALAVDHNSLEAPEQQFTRPLEYVWHDILQHMDVLNIVHFRANQYLTFLDVERTEFVNGLWLEEFAYHTAIDIGLGDDGDVGCGIKLRWLNSNVTNELDLLIVHRNRLLMMECKTMKLEHKNVVANEIVYKTSSIGEQLTGLFGTKVLLSALPLPEPALQRAHSKQIKVVYPWELRDFLMSWMEGISH